MMQIPGKVRYTVYTVYILIILYGLYTLYIATVYSASASATVYISASATGNPIYTAVVYHSNI